MSATKTFPAAQLLAKAESHEWVKLFIIRLHWNAPDHAPVKVACSDGVTRVVENVSSYSGIRVWVCPERPGSTVEAEIDRELAKKSTDRLVIFHNDIDQVWRWPVRRHVGQAVTARLTSHRHRSGQPNARFLDRLGVITLPTDQQLDANTVVAKIRSAFDVETENETKHASKLMARMYAAMEKCYPAGTPATSRDHDISLALARVLFLMFGDDTEMWTADAFRDFIGHHTAPDGSDLSEQLDLLFVHLNTAKPLVAPTTPSGFKYVNGGIFAEHLALPPLNREFRDVILEACVVDWSTISPAIFGSMFQSVRDADTRRKLGEHYTSETNILKTLNPLFLDELRGAYTDALGRDTTTKQVNALNALWKRLGDLRYIDPAAGCGNFLVVAFRELRDLELAVMEALVDRQHGSHQMTLGGDLVKALRVTLDHFHGIEIDEWPARIAETAMYLVDRQCDLKLRERFGEAPERLPIQTSAHIVVGNALTLPWEQVCPPSADVVIAGNPPFLGHGTRTPAQAGELKALWDRDDIGRLDYVTGWYVKALAFFADVDGRWAFVSTNSVVQGEPVEALFTAVFAGGWRIRFGHRTFAWTSEAVKAATVHCVILGFDRRTTPPAQVFEYPSPMAVPASRTVKRLNAYLSGSADVLISQRSKPLSPVLSKVRFGSRPNDGGALIVKPEDYEDVMADKVAARYVRRFVGARELMHDQPRHVLWLKDAPASDLATSPVLVKRLAECRANRLASKRAGTREWADRPQLFDFDSQPTTHYLAIPGLVSERRPYFTARRFGPDVISSNAVFTTDDPDGFQFGLVSSSAFITWQQTIGGRMKSDLRFSNTVVWNNFPIPNPAQALRTAIAEAGFAVEQARAKLAGLPLADLYVPGQLPDSLNAAHQTLDVLVDQLIGVPTGAGRIDREHALFDLYAALK